MKVTPKTEAEVSIQPLPAGIYDAEIGTAEDKVSNAGNEMIKVDVTVFDSKGNKRFVYDYLMDALPYKIRHACAAMGLLDKYEAGQITADDFINKSCKVKLRIKKDPSGTYADKNEIQDYVVEEKTSKPTTAKPELDDTIPF